MSTLVEGYWLSSNHADPRAIALYLRHYSARHYRDGRRLYQSGFCPPGEKMVLLTEDCLALFAWHTPAPGIVRPSGEVGVCCTIFRNEGPHLSSGLIREACELAWRRWPGRRLYTYVADRKVRSTNPGYCFLMAGWRRCGRSKKDRLSMLEVVPATWSESASTATWAGTPGASSSMTVEGGGTAPCTARSAIG